MKNKIAIFLWIIIFLALFTISNKTFVKKSNIVINAQNSVSESIINSEEREISDNIDVRFTKQVEKYLLVNSFNITTIFDVDDNNKIVFQINDNIIDFIIDEKFYLFSKNKLYIYNNKLYSYSFNLDNANYNLKSIKVDNNNIYIVGDKDNNGYIGIFNLNNNNLSLSYEYLIESKQYISFNSIIIMKEEIIIIGEKSGTCDSGLLQNVGNSENIKVFCVKINKENFNIVNELYINDTIYDEKILKVLELSDCFYILIKNLNKNMLYCISKDFNILPIQKYDNVDDIVQRIDEQVIYIKYNKNQIKIDDKLIYTDVNLKNFNIYKGNLYVYKNIDSKLYQIIISEYHINKNKPLILNKLYFDLENIYNFEIESYFENLTKKIQNYEPSFDKNIDGVYKIKYEITKENYEKFLVDGDLILEHFVNIIDKGVYKIGKELNFYGVATLNGQRIYSGHKIVNEGNYELLLTDCNERVRKYSFTVLNEYYYESQIVTFDAMYNVYQDEILELRYQLNSLDIKIENVIINNEDYDDFNFENYILTINLHGKNHYSIDGYFINEVHYKIEDQDYILKINEFITLKTLLKPLSLKANYEISNNSIQIDYSFFSTLKNSEIICLKTEVIYDNNDNGNNHLETATYYNYFNKEIKINIPKSKVVNIKKTIISHNGHKIKELEICNYSFQNDKEDLIKDVKIKKDILVKEINLEINPQKIKLKTININEINILENVSINKGLINTKNIIIISVIILALGVGYTIYKKIKKMLKYKR